MKLQRIDLQQARRESAERLYATGLLILKEAGVKTWEFHERGLSGRAWTKRAHVLCPKPTTRRRLYVLAHECAHIAHNHTGSKPSHQKEYEAELYAHEALRRHGVSVPKKETEIAKQYVARRIDQAIRIGKAKKLDRDAITWCEAAHRPATRRALATGAVALEDLSRTKRMKRPRTTKPKDKRPKPEPHLSDVLRTEAKKSGLSVNQIAKLTGLDQSGLNRFLVGTRQNIRLDVADRLFRLFKLVIRRRDRPGSKLC